MSDNELDRIRAVYEERRTSTIAARYSPQQPGELYGLRRRREASQTLLHRHCPQGLRGMRVLDVGCGQGARLSECVGWGAAPESLYGVDLIEPFIRQARQAFPASRWLVASGDALPFSDGTFDLVTQAMAASSILDQDMRDLLAAEMWRVATPGGLILWYDLRLANPQNHDMRPISRSELFRLFPLPPLETHSLTLLPPLARLLAGHSQPLCRLLERLPFLRSHRIALFRKEDRR